MIVTSTPLRLSFLGGGSDIPQYFNKKAGMVISTTIDKKIQIAVNSCQTNHIRAVYSEMEVVSNRNLIKHDRIRESLKLLEISNNIEICSFSDVPTKGTGLGSSSTFTVGLLHALYNFNGQTFNKRDLAETACEIEIDRCKEPIGKQDQYAAAYGGFNVIRFDSSGVEVTPVNIGSASLEKLNLNLMCFSTGISRSTADILSDQVNNVINDQAVFQSTTDLVNLAELGLFYLRNNKIDDFGALLHEAWELKKKLSDKISNDYIDLMYDTAIGAGAIGGKVLGAGGGGYMLFYVPEQLQSKVSRAMREYKRFHFKFTDQGSVSQTL